MKSPVNQWLIFQCPAFVCTENVAEPLNHVIVVPAAGGGRGAGSVERENQSQDHSITCILECWVCPHLLKTRDKSCFLPMLFLEATKGKGRPLKRSDLAQSYNSAAARICWTGRGSCQLPTENWPQDQERLLDFCFSDGRGL